MKNLVLAEVTDITAFAEGQRVLLDFMEVFDEDCYVLVGNTFHGFIAVISENHQTENYKPRRFRFNIGSLHQYVLAGDGKLVYADEIRSGDVIYVGKKNNNDAETYRELVVARVKIELRPFIKIQCKHKDMIFSAILQTDATTAFIGENEIIPLADLRVGSKIYTLPWGEASHLGSVKKEYCEEY